MRNAGTGTRAWKPRKSTTKSFLTSHTSIWMVRKCTLPIALFKPTSKQLSGQAWLNFLSILPQRTGATLKRLPKVGLYCTVQKTRRKCFALAWIKNAIGMLLTMSRCKRYASSIPCIPLCWTSFLSLLLRVSLGNQNLPHVIKFQPQA